MLSHFFPQPFPESLDGIEVRAVSRKGYEMKTKRSRLLLNDTGLMPGSVIPDDDNTAFGSAQPGGNLVERVGLNIIFVTLIVMHSRMDDERATENVMNCRMRDVFWQPGSNR